MEYCQSFSVNCLAQMFPGFFSPNKTSGFNIWLGGVQLSSGRLNFPCKLLSVGKQKVWNIMFSP